MKRLVLLLVAGGIAALAAPSGALAAKKACPGGGDTMAQNELVRVYTKAGADEIDPVYACVFKKGRPFKLDGIKGPECQNARRVSDVVLAGTMIALGITECELTTAFDYLSVWNATKRKLIRKAAGGVAPQPPPNLSPAPDGETDIASIVLKPSGAVAWIGRGSFEGAAQPNIEVRRISADGKNTLLDSGADIDGASLALARGGTIYWRKGAVLRSASL